MSLLAFLKKHKSLIFTAAAASTAAAAGYCWWSWLNAPDSSSRAENTEFVKVSTKPDSEGEPKADQSLSQHFDYIQEVSVPLELQQHLAPMKTLLFELTDPNLLKQYQNSLLQSSTQELSAAEKLRFLAKVSVSRAISTCWLLPLLDLYIRVKLNLIGRHMFLQSKINQASGCTYEQQLSLPPRLSPAALEGFLGTSHWMHNTIGWIVQQVMQTVEQELLPYSADCQMTPQQLGSLICRIMSQTEETLAPPSDASWGQLILGSTIATPVDMQQALSGSMESYNRALSTAAVVDDFNHQLSIILSSDLFAIALKESVRYTFRWVSNQVYTNILSSQPAASNANDAVIEQTARPFARMLKPVQASCQPVLQDPKRLSQELGCLSGVRALSAAAFASM